MASSSVVSPKLEKRGPGRPRASAKEHKGQKRADILRSAIEVFGANGFEGASLAKIAAKADTDIGLIRYYFGAKAELWQACIEYIGDINDQEGFFRADEALDGLSGLDKLEHLVRWFAGVSQKHPQIFRLVLAEVNNESGVGDIVYTRLVGPLFESINKVLDEAKAEGIISSAISSRALFFVVTHGVGIPLSMPGFSNKLPGKDITTEEGVQEHVDSILTLLLGYPPSHQ